MSTNFSDSCKGNTTTWHARLFTAIIMWAASTKPSGFQGTPWNETGPVGSEPVSTIFFEILHEVKSACVILVILCLCRSAWTRNKTESLEFMESKDTIEERPIMTVFEEAVMTGWDARTANGTECQERYFLCPLNTPDLLLHVDTVQQVNVL